MEKKMVTIVLAVAVIGLSLGFAAYSDDVDAVVDGIDVPAVSEGGEVINMQPNKGATTAIAKLNVYGPMDITGLTSEGVWAVEKSTGTYTLATMTSWNASNIDTITDADGVALSFAVTQNGGEYSSVITATGISTGVTIKAAFGIVTYSGTSPAYGSQATVEPIVQQWIEYKITITAAGSATTTTGMLFESNEANAAGSAGGELFNSTGNVLTMKTGTYTQYDMSKVMATPAASTAGAWYAKGLPEGLSISPNGVIYGYLAAPVSQPVSTVLTLNVAGTVYTATINVCSSDAASPSLTVGVKSVTGVGTPSLVQSNGGDVVNRYVTVAPNPGSLGTVTVTLDLTGANGLFADDFSYEVLATEGSGLISVSPEADGDTLTIQYSGTGEFIINISYGAEVTTLMQLVTFAPVNGVVPGIGFGVVDKSTVS